MVNLSKTRNIISVILCAVIAVLTTLMLTAFTLQATFGNKSFVKKFLVTDNLVSQCEKELDENYTALEIKSGIPKRIFLSVEKDFSTKDSLNLAAENMFSNESSTLKKYHTTSRMSATRRVRRLKYTATASVCTIPTP